MNILYVIICTTLGRVVETIRLRSLPYKNRAKELNKKLNDTFILGRGAPLNLRRLIFAWNHENEGEGRGYVI